MKIVHSFKSKTFGKRKMICSKLRLGRGSCKRQRLPSCLLWQRGDYQPRERERDNLSQVGYMNDMRGGKLEVDARQQFMFGRRDCPPTGNNLCQAKIYIRQNLMWEKTRFLAKYHFRQKIIFDRNSCWQQFMLGNNSYFAKIYVPTKGKQFILGNNFCWVGETVRSQAKFCGHIYKCMQPAKQFNCHNICIEFV